MQQNKERMLQAGKSGSSKMGGSEYSTELKIELFTAFIKQYELTRWLRKLQRADPGQNDQAQAGGALARSVSRVDMK